MTEIQSVITSLNACFTSELGRSLASMLREEELLHRNPHLKTDFDPIGGIFMTLEKEWLYGPGVF